MNTSTTHELAALCKGMTDKTFDLASDDQRAARLVRSERAARSARVRENELRDARAAYRLHGIKTPFELLSALQNVHAAITDTSAASWMHPYREALLELVTNMDADLNTPPDPERELARARRIADTPL